MRNLKKILALVMALVMSLSLVTIANASDFTDADEITYEEAADVMSAIGVIEGFEDGSFDPDGTLTREQAAKLVTYMLLGDNADNLGIESSSFNDVAVDRWSAPAIEYCYSMGIIDGAGDGNYYPAGQLTAVAFAKVLLTALGYDSEVEGLVGGTWSVNTAALAMEVGLDNGIETLNWNDPLSREEAAQMGLNAICAPLVAYEGGVTVMVGDTPVSFGSGDAYYVTTTIAREQRISDRRLTNASSTTPNYTVEFGERYFPLLRLDTEADEFNRPSHTWVYENVELGTYVDYDLLVETYTESVSNRTLYDLLGRSNLEDYQFEYYVDGIDITSIDANAILARNARTFGQSGRGVLTQVFVDHEYDNATGRIVITSINTWLAQVTTGYNANRENATMNVFVNVDYSGISPNEVADTVESAYTVNSADVDGVDALVEEQFVLVNMSGKDNITSLTNYNKDALAYNQLEVVKITDVEILSDSTITKYSKSSNNDPDSDKNEALFSSVTSGSMEYKGAKKAFYSDEVLDLYNNSLLTGKSYNIYLDPYGNAIGVDLYAGEDNYVFITGFDTNGSNIAMGNADAGAIFLDGKMQTIRVNVTDTNKNIERVVDLDNVGGDEYFALWSTAAGNYPTDEPTRVNRWFTYTVDANNVYTLNPATRMFTTTADNGTNTYISDPTHTIRCDNVVLEETMYNSTNDSTGHHPTIAKDAGVRAYGNDNSVYIVATLGTVSNSSSRKVITGVDGVYTGVQSVEIDLEYRTRSDSANAGMIAIGGDLTDPDALTGLYDNTYTLYDKNNYIIASVVIGDAKGTSANYAYILTAATSEGIGDDGTYYWTFDAILDGTIQTLTVASKFTSTINDLQPGHVQELRFNGEYVSAIKDVPNAKIYSGAFNHRISAGDHEVYDMGHVPVACGFSDASSYATEYQRRLDVEDLHLEGRTLYLSSKVGDRDYGLTLADTNTPTVVIQEVDYDEEQVEYTSVSSALASLADADGDYANGKFGFEGRVIAVLNSQGVAEWVVIISDTPVYTSAGGQASDKRVMTVNVNIVGVNSMGGVTSLGTYPVYNVKSGDTIELPNIPGWTPLSAYDPDGDGRYTISVGSGAAYDVQFINGGVGNITVTYEW